MSEHDDIIDFDFFDEPPTVEQGREPRTRIAMPRRKPREGGPPRPPMRPPQGFTPLLRLVGLVAFAILIVVLLVFWVQSCQSNARKNAYKNYLANVSDVAHASTSVGSDLASALTTQGEKRAHLQQTVQSLAQREQQDVQKAVALHPPGPLRDQQAAVVEALQFRVSGLQGLAATLGSSSTQSDAQVLAQQSERFIASDVVWSDLFHDPAVAELKKQGITGVQVPTSTFVGDPTLITSDTWSRILQRLAGASTGGKPGGLHGTGLEYVKALPGNQVLSTSSENTVTATTDLGFAVGVKDTGNSQEVGIEVTLTLQKSGTPIVKTQKIQVIDPNQTKVVVFKNLGQVPFAQKTTLKVDIAPVPNEANTKNNSGAFPVIFSLG